MQVDDPPYLTVGTAVSAKYKGAFCEAKVRNVVRIVRCKVTYKMGLGTAVVNDDQVKGTLRVGHVVQVKHPERKELVEATVQKIQDCSQYTVVFDDGDITTLRRTALCLKSGRHFNESETLDQLPLTHPEHFGNPVVGGRRGRRNRQLKEDSSEGEAEEENEPDLEGYSTDIGRVVSVETSEKKRGKDNWFPGLVVIPSAQATVRINVKDEYLVRSFKDGRYYTVPKKEVSEFNREVSDKVESAVLGEAVNKALKYLDHNELPVHWERGSLFNIQSMDSDSDDNLSDSSDDEPCEEKDHFVAQLYKFMDDSGTPLNKSPVIANKDVDLHRLFRVVHKLGGYNRVTNQNKWKSVSNRLKLPNNQNALNQVKQVYKKCLLSYEAFHRTLGVTMLNHTRSTKKNRGRSLIRDKDRFTPVNSPKPETNDEIEKKEDEKDEKIVTINRKPKIEEKKKKELNENTSDTSGGDATDQSESQPSTSKDTKDIKDFKDVGRPKRLEKKEKKIKAVIEPQQTRSKVRNKEILSPERKKEIKTKSAINKEDRKRGKKKTIEEKVENKNLFNIGDKLRVYYGPNHESKVTYEAKIIEVDREQPEIAYLVHYTGWNTRYDEWIIASRIAENLSTSTKAKRSKHPNIHQQQPPHPSTSTKAPKVCSKRGRGVSVTSRNETPRSTTPSSTTSTSSRTKSPATPATRSTSRLTRQEYGRKTRRTSAQTDNSNHSESDSESESDDVTRKNEVNSPTVKTYKKKNVEEKRGRGKRKKSPEKSTEEGDSDEDEDESGNPPKGRDFDLNQIRSELKGFSKAIKVVEATDKEQLTSSSEDSNNKIEDIDEIEESKSKDKSPTSTPSTSEDIYEFKEPEPFEFESRPKLGDDKTKKRVPRLFEDLDKSPKKSPTKDSPSPPEPEKKRFNKTPVKEIEEVKKEDPFDKLVESPSFNIVKSADKSPEDREIKDKQKAVSRSILDEPIGLFRELPETIEDSSRDMELSDNESHQAQIYTREEQLFVGNFTKPSPELEVKKESDDENDSIRESIQRAIANHSSTDDDSTDTLLVTPSTSNYQVKKKEPEVEKPEPNEIPKDIKHEAIFKTISPALQESDNSLLETIKEQPILITNSEETKDINVKPIGSKIADSILQKFNSLKEEIKKNEEVEEEDEGEKSDEVNTKDEPKLVEVVEEKKVEVEKKRRKILSRPFIEESDSDSSDSEQLVIARSDDESQTSSQHEKADLKESDSNISKLIETDDDSQSQQSQQETRNFKFDDLKVETKSEPEMEPTPQQEDDGAKTIAEEEDEEEEEEKLEQDNKKNEEADSHLHSLLLCEETLPPRSPASATEPQIEQKLLKSSASANKSLEMPFASAPSSSNNKNILLSNEGSGGKSGPIAPIMPLIENNREAPNTVIDNTPPTTPESTISNLSPRDDHLDLLSPNNDIESGKSNDADFLARKRRNSNNKVHPYSEEDTQMTSEPNSAKKNREDTIAAPCKKRRKSNRGCDDTPAKRGRKPLNRSRHNSDSDDTSEHSIGGNTNLGINPYESRTSRSPRPSKYNFYVEFDPSLNSGQRIAVLQQKLSELRKTYANVKSELAAVERRRKKIRRREREALKASKQEMACA